MRAIKKEKGKEKFLCLPSKSVALHQNLMHSEFVRRSLADVKSKYLKRNNSVRKKVLSNRLSYGCSSLMYACQQGDIAEVLERLHTKVRWMVNK